MEPTDSNFVALSQSANANTNIVARFHYQAVRQAAKSIEAGRDIFEDVLYVEKMIKGQPLSVVCRAAKPEDFREFPREYAAFQQGADTPVSGTPLKMLPNMTPARVRELEYLNIRTVEDMANINDAACQKIMGANDLRAQCRRYLAAAGAEAVQADHDEVAALKEQVAALNAKLAATPKRKTVKKRRTVKKRKYTRREPAQATA